MVEDIVILNAADMRLTSFACYMGVDKSFTDLKFHYDDVKNAVYLTPKAPTKFNQILNVYYGKAGDVNLCQASTF